MVIAGYFGRPADFQQFEIETNNLFSQYDIDVFHSMKFQHRKGPFKNWGIAKKREFLEQWYLIIDSCCLFGVCASINKDNFKLNLKNNKAFSGMSPLAYAFSRMVFGMLEKLPIEDDIPVSFIIESGNSNNNNLVLYFNWLKNKSSWALANWLDSISFVNKADCRAIQLADLLAFYGRKAAQQWDNDGYPSDFPQSDFLDIILKSGNHHFERSYGNFHFGDIQAGGLLPGLSILPRNGGLRTRR